MNRKKNVVRLQKLLYVLEICMSILIIIGIIISIPDLIKYMTAIVVSGRSYSYDLYQAFLSHVLLMVIGLEFVAMLISHEEYQIIYIMTMVVARKMLVYGSDTMSLFIGVAAIAILFIVRKYFTLHKILANAGIAIFDSTTNIRSVNEHLVQDIETNKNTIGEHVRALFEEDHQSLQKGGVVEDDYYIYQIESMKEDRIGLIALEEKHKGI
ncbi:hypothetical protein [Aedoeadaptatus coxii]|uniref:hypothetical protein n=1 Tax=Aedoeadaptatus coxii TaxID=755172 RepID=UPI002AD335A3|nr:hypothetical protein [Peptoniphilus coxii]